MEDVVTYRQVMMTTALEASSFHVLIVASTPEFGGTKVLPEVEIGDTAVGLGRDRVERRVFGVTG